MDRAHYATHKNEPIDYRIAKKLRREPTNGEEILWYQLRLVTKNRGFKFRRQHPVHPYIVDFVCLKLRLIIEVDGNSHDSRVEQDRQRDEHLKAMGFETLRFSNEEVIKNRETVVMAILDRANAIF